MTSKRSISKCSNCGSDRLEIKSITHTISGGNNTAFLDIEVETCQMCGEIFLTPEQVDYFEEVKAKLENELVDDFRIVGKSFKLDY